MRKFLAIFVCRMLTWIGKIVGKGTSLPGKYALKVCPDILRRIRKPKTIIAVTGSNGKTSTVEMIAAVLKANGKTVAYNESDRGCDHHAPQLLHPHGQNEAGCAFDRIR